MICTGCGSKIPDGSKFCPYCGFNGANAANTPAMQEKSKTERKPSRRSKEPPIRVIDPERKPQEDTAKWWIWAIIAAVCAAILAFVIILGSNYVDYKELTSLNIGSGEANSDSSSSEDDLSTVTITLPASMFEEEDMSTFDADAYAREQNFLSAKVNSDGSVTVTMTKATHKELISATEKSIQDLIDSLINGENTPYIVQIDHNDDYTHFELYVYQAPYSESFDLTPYMLAVTASTYQMFTEMEFHTEVEIIDFDTDRIIDTVYYPEE